MGKKLPPLLTLLLLINMLNYFDRYVISAVLEPLGKDLHLTDTQLGYFPFVFLIVYMIAAPFVGMFAARVSRTKLIGIAVGVWSLATAGAAFASSFEQLLVSRSLLGIGEAVYATLGPAILCDLFSEDQRASKFTWFYLAIPVGSALGFGVAGMIAGAFGWRSAFLVAGIPGLILSWFMWHQPDPVKGRFDEAPEAALTDHRNYLTLVRAIFKNRTWVSCTLAYVAYTFAMGSLTHWYPSMVQRRFGVTTGQAGMIFGAIAVITGLLGTFAGGWVTSKFQKTLPRIGLTSSAATLCLSAPFIYMSLNVADATSCYIYIGIAMFLLFFNTSPVNAITVSAVNAAERPVANSLNVFMIHILGDAISPEIVGLRSEALGGTGEALSEALKIAVIPTILAGLILLVAMKGFRHGNHSTAPSHH